MGEGNGRTGTSVRSRDKLDRQLTALRQGDHLCLIYESPAEQRAAVVPYLRQGLQRGERCMYISDDRTADDLAAALTALGTDVVLERERGALLLLTTRETYLRSGSFDPTTMIDLLRQAADEAIAAGFTGLRGAAEMTWALGSEAGCERLIEYEALVNTHLPGSPITAICQYDRGRFTPTIIRQVLRTHPIAILGNQVCPNLYYEPPELVLGRGSDAARVEWMLLQLQRARAAETARAELIREQAARIEAERAAERLAEQEKKLTLLQERQRIAMDLHDGVIQSLYAVGLGLTAHDNTLDEHADRTRQVLSQAIARINAVVEDIRAYIFHLRPQELSDQGLRAGLQTLAAEIQSVAQIRPRLDLDADVDGLIEAGAVASLLHVAREATANVIRHSSASSVHISLTRSNGHLVLAIRDNGRGFDPEHSNGRAGDGLRNMAERARGLGGCLVVMSQPGRGAEVRLEVPVSDMAVIA